MKKSLKILENTLRDGGYSIDFQFTPEDTSQIALQLENAGVEYIEIGHGLGLHGREAGHGNAAGSDWEYLRETRKSVKKANIGMFCIPGIGRLRDVRKSVDLGMDFIRIGVNIDDVRTHEKFFKNAKKAGLFVTANLMKSYAVNPDKFARIVKTVSEFGVDVVYLVDSAGGMLPESISDYYNATRCHSNIPMGFHGHNNLGMANANSLRAAQLGFSMIDASLKGLGRSAGNAVTEMMVVLLKKAGFSTAVDEYKIMDLAENTIAPMAGAIKNDPISVISGFADFHSSFMAQISKYAKKYGVDPRRLIVALTQKDKINAPSKLLDNLAADLKKREERGKYRNILLPVYYSKGTGSLKGVTKVSKILQDLNALAKKKGVLTVLNAVLSKQKLRACRFSDHIQENSFSVIGSLEYSRIAQLERYSYLIDGNIDYCLLDYPGNEENKTAARKGIAQFKKTTVLLYRDDRVWAETIVELCLSLIDNKRNTNVLSYGADPLADEVNAALRHVGAEVTDVTSKTINDFADAVLEKISLVVIYDKKHKLTRKMLNKCTKLRYVVDAKIGGVSEDLIKSCKSVKYIRPDMRAALAGELFGKIYNSRMLKADMGAAVSQGTRFVAGGVLGRKGDVVVDSIEEPKRIIGLSRGDGTVDYAVSANLLKKYQSRLKHLTLAKNYDEK